MLKPQSTLPRKEFINLNPFSLMIILILTIQQFNQVQSIPINSVSVQTDPSTIKLQTVLSVSAQVTTQIPINGKILIQIPLEMSLFTSNSLSCSMSFPTGVTIKSCQSSRQIITITVSTLISQGTIQFKINNAVTNPSTTLQTSTFKFYTQSAISEVLDSQESNIFLSATPGQIISTSLVPQSDIVGASTSLLVSFQTSNGIPTSGVIKMKFPKWNTKASLTSQVDYFLLPQTISCQTKKVLSASISCSYLTNDQILTITNSISSDISSNVEVSFLVSGFTNTLSTDTITGFTIQTMDSQGGFIDETSSPTMKISTPAALTSASIQVESSTDSSIAGIVQEKNKMRLGFTVPVPLESTCTISIRFPTQFSISTITTITACFSDCQDTPFTKITATNTITLSSCQKYISKQFSGQISIDSLQLPSYTKTTDSVSISISTTSSVATLSSGVTYKANPGTITVQSVTAQTPVVQASTSISINIKPQHTISGTSKLVVTFPTTYTLPSVCTVTNIANTNSNAKCNLVSGMIEITDFLLDPYFRDTTSTPQFKINSLILPPTIASNTGLSFAIYQQDSTDSQYYLIDQTTVNDPITLQNGGITLNVVPTSSEAFALTTYTFKVKPDNQITRDGYMILSYPSQISIPDSSFSQSQCRPVSPSTFPSTPSCIIDTSKRTIQIRNGFRGDSPNKGTIFSFTIPNVQNPSNLDKSDTFTATTYASTDISIDVVLTGVTIQMSTAAQMRTTQLTIGSYVNAAITDYTFQLAASIPITESNKLMITYPTEIIIPTSASDLNCQSSDTNLFTSVSCQLTSTSNAVQVTFKLKQSQLAASQSFSITMSKIQNPISTKPSSPFKIEFFDSIGKTVNTNQITIQAATNTPATIKKANITQLDKGPRQNTTYTLVFTPINNINIGGGIQIIYPSQVSIPDKLIVTVSSLYTKSIVTATIDKSARQILITDAFQLKFLASTVNDITIKMVGFQNPSTNELTNSFIVKTFNIENTNFYYYIDQVSDGLILNSLCDYPCKTCTAANSANCTTCYDNSTLNKLQGGTCVTECSIGKFYNTKTKACEICDSSCLGCANSATQCTACGSDKNKLFLFNSTCQSTCPSGYVSNANLNKCVQCSNECQTCDFTANTCTACDSLSLLYPYFYKQTCLLKCPIDISVLADNKTCSDCDPTCKTCRGSTNYCTSCESHMKFDQVANQCIKMCNEGTQIFNETRSICLPCNDNCGTCSSNVTTCTSCKTGLVLNTDNTCMEKCKLDSQTPINSICKQCELPCAQCKDRTNRCTKCSDDFLLYNTSCVQYCPEKYEANNSTGQCILVGLICPDGFTINEAGDGCIPNDIECKKGYMVNKGKTACVPAPGFPVPFPFLFLSVCLGLLVLGSYIKDKQMTRLYSLGSALIGTQEMLIYFLIIAYSGSLMKWIPLVLALVGAFMLMATNIYFYVIFKRDISKDPSYQKWVRHFPKTGKYIPIIALIVNFKFIKLLYSGFFGMESCLARFEDPFKTFMRPMKIATYFSYVFVYGPIFVASFVIFAQVQWGYQLLVLAIESLLLGILMIALQFFEFRQGQTLFLSKDEQYVKIKPRSMENDMVMGGIGEMDESTLVRSRGFNDDYEVQLRKRALMSILDQVGKNYLIAQKQGVNLGGKIDLVKTKFDDEKLKLRRAFSLEEIKEEESWEPSENSQFQGQNNMNIDDLDESREERLRRRYSFPIVGEGLNNLPNPNFFNEQLNKIKQAKQEPFSDNVYAEVKKPQKEREYKKRKTVSRRTQTYLRELLNLEGEEFEDSDLEIVMEDDAEINQDFAKGLIENVLDGLSESGSEGDEKGKRKGKKKKKKTLNNKRAEEIPDFELADIMGEFEIDDLGNFIILRGDKGELLDKQERRVNRRGYLIDRFGNVINNKGQIIFKAVELDSDDEIPAPFGFEKRKKNLLTMGEDGEFKIEEEQITGGDQSIFKIENDEDMIDKELRQMKKQQKRGKRRRMNEDGSIVEEEDEDGDDNEADAKSSSVDSLMADSPSKYQINDNNEDEVIDRITRKRLPKPKPGTQQSNTRKGYHQQKDSQMSSDGGQSNKNRKHKSLAPKRIKQDDAKDLFPSLAIDGAEQRKLFKLAESIGGFASQMAATNERVQTSQSVLGGQKPQAISQERLDRLKQEHYKDIISDSNFGSLGGPGGPHQPQSRAQTSHYSIDPNKRILPEVGNMIFNDNKPSANRPQSKNTTSHVGNYLERVYGNVNDVVSFEERQIMEQLRGLSPNSSDVTSRIGGFMRHESSVHGGGGQENRRLRGLESIYMQRFEKGKSKKPLKKQTKAKFRQTVNRFVDDPEFLVDDNDFNKNSEVSLQVADKLDKLQRQYMSNTNTNRFQSLQNHQIPMRLTGQNFSTVNKQDGRMSGQLYRADPSLEPVKKGNWIERQ